MGQVVLLSSGKPFPIYLVNFEIDRLAFLHQAMKDRGEKVPTLSQIAADIQGTKPWQPKVIVINMEAVPLLAWRDGFQDFLFWCELPGQKI